MMSNTTGMERAPPSMGIRKRQNGEKEESVCKCKWSCNGSGTLKRCMGPPGKEDWGPLWKTNFETDLIPLSPVHGFGLISSTCDDKIQQPYNALPSCHPKNFDPLFSFQSPNSNFKNAMANPESNLPPGFRFHPTDEELILHYLRKKIASIPLPVSIIAEVDIYKFDPWDLPAKAAFGEKEWYFFSPRDRKYPNGVRPNRAAASGYWKATGTDKTIMASLHGGRRSQENIGVKKALVFYKGRPPKGIKTNWIMHEYRLLDNHNNKPIKLRDSSMRLDDWVLCRIYRKSKYALPETETTVVGLHEHDQAEEYLLEDTHLPPSSKTLPAPQNTLISQKSVSFSNLLDAMDYSMLSSFLSDQNQLNNPTRCGSGAPLNSVILDQSSASPHHNSCDSNINSYLFQLNNPSSAVPNMENCRPKRQLSNIDEDTIPSTKKYLSSCNFANSQANTQYENPQWNFLLKQSLLNQQLLLGPHLFQG